MNQCLSKIAEAYPHVKIMRARSDFLGLDEYPDVGMPTLIFFKDGKQLHNHIAIHKKLKTEKFTTKLIEQFFLDNKIIERVINLDNEISKSTQKKKSKSKKKFQKISFYGNNSNSVHSFKTKTNNNNNNNSDDDSELDID